MKINSLLNHINQPLENTNIQNFTKESLSNPFDFKASLSNAQVISNQGVVKELIEKFERQEKVVEKNPTMANLYEYKKIIRDVLNIASQNYKCMNMDLYSNQGYQKVVSYSALIDEKLNNIITDFMDTNKLSLESVSQMEDIKGLILDVLV